MSLRSLVEAPPTTESLPQNIRNNTILRVIADNDTDPAATKIMRSECDIIEDLFTGIGEALNLPDHIAQWIREVKSRSGLALEA